MKKVSETEERIVTMALEMFNRSGVEYVGMRELAAALDMRVGNVTYYFPTKDDLVNRLSVDLAEENNRTIVPMNEVTMKGFFEMLRQVFHNHLKYRCLMLSFVHLMERNSLIAKRYGKIQTKRNETWSNNVLALRKGKYITAESQEEIDFLVSTIALIARFWISEATISYKDHTQQEQIAHYLNMIARIFLPYATPKGRKELDEAVARYLGTD
jgi:AcrR family transcriptional regulator